MPKIHWGIQKCVTIPNTFLINMKVYLPFLKAITYKLRTTALYETLGGELMEIYSPC